ncbi:acyltransferase family protein [Pseudarthrobacter sp. J64]|uniref:acyltransferase family protein n=1 Tax=Pseudarthrobacter sp. J64 TaxID=3116485 RepID=UPI002E81B581|nr:acyltransferase family protein [Pseudarthrobacter sp. J64]MEE2568151.1 acyltransferase family protein [Pseudarthrobacter sp. J64]
MSAASNVPLSLVGPKNPDRQRKSAFRPEIQGLRSLAVLMVVTYHVWFGRVSGGVDVFLLISAFLMTLQFTGRYQRGEPSGLLRHWLHLFRRLLPAAVVVILSTLVASALLLPRTRWLDVIDHSWAALFYFENWLLQQQAVDYYANDHSLASPLQHFWSLSIQGQVFILWPVIFLVAAVIARRAGISYRPLLAYIFFGIFLVSLAYSIVFTASNQGLAYFDTGARLWEFALGTLVALVLPGLRAGRTARIVMGWIGVVAMLSCGFVIDVQGAFPGLAALWPTVAASLVILAGQTQSRLGVDRILSAAPLVRLGDNSYALYLWHWPVLVIALAWSGKEHAGWLSGTIIIVTSLGLAFLTTWLVEKPWREWRWPEVNRRRASLAVMLVVAVAATPLVVWQQMIVQSNSKIAVGQDPMYPGALSLDQDYVPTTSGTLPPAPGLEAIDLDWPVFPEGCGATGPGENICSNGIEDGAKNIVVVGNSHAHVLNTPLLLMAEKYHWGLTSITKGGCPMTSTQSEGVDDECLEFNGKVLDQVLSMKPDLVISTSTRTAFGVTAPEHLDDGWVANAKVLTEAGIPVLGVRAPPRMAAPVPACLEGNPGDPSSCGSSAAESFSPVAPTDTLAEDLPGVTFVDFTPYFCPDGICPAIIGNVIVYKDDNHVTRSYMTTLAPIFERELLAATGWSL